MFNKEIEYYNVSGFCDINIPVVQNVSDQLIDKIVEYNYRAIALNWTVDVSNSEGRVSVKKKKKGDETPSTTDSNFTVLPEVLIRAHSNIVQKNLKKLKVFLRLTIIFARPEQLKIVLASDDTRKYDLIAVLPTTETAYQHACSNFNVDVISFEIGITNYKPQRKLHKQLVDRNGYFEISYAQALKSSSKRQETITMAQLYHIYGKSKNAILSSGASNYLELRNPYDVANLGLLFGLTEEQSKCSLSRNCKLLMLTAAGRRYGKVPIIVHPRENEDEEEPSRKRSKLSDTSDISEVTFSISSLSTTERK